MSAACQGLGVSRGLRWQEGVLRRGEGLTAEAGGTTGTPSMNHCRICSFIFLRKPGPLHLPEVVAGSSPRPAGTSSFSAWRSLHICPEAWPWTGGPPQPRLGLAEGAVDVDGEARGSGWEWVPQHPHPRTEPRVRTHPRGTAGLACIRRNCVCSLKLVCVNYSG